MAVRRGGRQEKAEYGRANEIVTQETGFGSRFTYQKEKFIVENADDETVQMLDEDVHH